MANDPYWSNTSLLLHGDTAGDPYGASLIAGFSGNLDAADKGILTSVGSPTRGTYAGRKCYALGGATQNIGAYSSTVSGLFDGDFTVEFWAYFNSHLTYDTMFTASVGATNTYTGCALYYSTAGGYFNLTVRNQGDNIYVAALSLSTWHHFAITSLNGVASLYIDGVRVGYFSVANSTSYTTCNGGKLGNASGLSSTSFNGYGSDLRMYKGVVKYTGATYTVPTWPMQAYSTFVDSSPIGREVSAPFAISAVYTSDYALGGGALQFDGTNYATIAASTDFVFGTADFTVEFWMKSSLSWAAQASSCGLVCADSGQWCTYKDGAFPTKLNFRSNGNNFPSVSTPAQNAWEHWAFCRASGRLLILKNGVLDAAYTHADNITTNGPLYLGFAPTWSGKFTGLMDEVRVTKGVARYPLSFTPAVNVLSAAETYWAYTVLGMTFNTDFSDVRAHTLTNYGASINTSTKKFGAASAYFNGASYIDVAASADFSFGTGDFAIEAWLNPTAVPGGDYTKDMLVFGGFAATPNFLVALDYSALKPLLWDGTTQFTSSVGLTPGVWSHVVWCRISGILLIFVNGAITAFGACATNFSSVVGLYIGGEHSTGNRFFNGYIDDLRITKGVSRYGRVPVQSSPHPEGMTTVSGTVTDASGALCSRTVNAHSRANGRLLGTAVSDPVTGVYSIGVPETCYVVVLDSTGDYDALILDRINPVT